MADIHGFTESTKRTNDTFLDDWLEIHYPTAEVHDMFEVAFMLDVQELMENIATNILTNLLGVQP